MRRRAISAKILAIRGTAIVNPHSPPLLMRFMIVVACVTLATRVRCSLPLRTCFQTVFVRWTAGQISFPSCSHPIDPGTGVTDFVSPLPFGNALPMSIGNEDVSSKPSGSCSLPPAKKGKKVKFLCKITPRQRLYGRCGDLTAARLRRLFQREWPP